jgi:ceramide glucosyltransferase
MLVVAASAYSVIAWLSVTAKAGSARGSARAMPPVTVLKPLCGVEPGTYECLRSFCVQSYPEYQVIFGIADPDDPVVAVARRLQAEFPARDLRVVIDCRQHGSSRKVSNLINMMPHASHGLLVLSDSDVIVTPGYLAAVVAPLSEPDVGIVTCPYNGIAREGAWARLESLYINDWFMPSVRVAAMTGSRAFAFGATIALQRETLDRIGGFESIVNQLADDYRLGELTRGLGLRTVLSDLTVDIDIAVRSLGEFVEHELRWLCTIRTLRPFAYSFCFITFTIPVALLATWLAGRSEAAVGMLSIAVAARVLLHWQTRQGRASATQLLMLPVRDTLSLGMWTCSLLTRRVRWGNDEFQVARDGSVELVVR